MKVGDLVRVPSEHLRIRGEPPLLGVILKMLHDRFAEVLIFDDGERQQYHIGHLEVICK